MAIEWDVSKADAALIGKIADRAESYFTKHEVPFKRVDFVMDVTAVHRNGCPLRLADLLGAEDFDFSHDIAGITEHIDRTTGQLGSCFLPRYAV